MAPCIDRHNAVKEPSRAWLTSGNVRSGQTEDWSSDAAARSKVSRFNRTESGRLGVPWLVIRRFALLLEMITQSCGLALSAS